MAKRAALQFRNLLVCVLILTSGSILIRLLQSSAEQSGTYSSPVLTRRPRHGSGLNTELKGGTHLLDHQPSLDELWDFFGDVYIVHLPGVNNSADRLDSAKAQLSAVGLWKRATIWNASQNENGHYGCWEAHKSIARDAVRKNHKRVLIFEDDVAFRPAFVQAPAAYLGPAIRCLRKGAWDVLYFVTNPTHVRIFGAEQQPLPIGGGAAPSPRVVGVRGWAAVAYSINGDALRALAESTFEELPSDTVDGLLHRLTRSFSFTPMPA